ncbi:Electron transfer flavoprotein alpha/beta-subunit N-terminal [Arabidopsis thaliana x Arabidopsis arenosa]|uniref:Electron transfer flavoprotein subunit alpha n=1 Tax=Arabidopsis thaliana x Arabidopsis arenosa TaxID=1240361 RepID=A0A8T2C918_9BRAS|nr:Electron transfer flavoprotein alpha/beta-subunit N-terminal [Arabidopsis thaliana x Arabidopsis arenosa]
MTRTVLLRALTKNKFVASNSPRSISISITNLSRCISTLILAEHESGSIKPQTVSTVVAANSLGENSSISLLLAGSGSSLQEAASQAASCHPSVSEVLVADSDKFEHPLAEPWAKLVDFVRLQGDYSHILASSSSFGKNLLPRVAALLDVSPITDVVKILGSNHFIRPIYAGNALCTVRYTGAGPCMLTIRSTSFPVTPITENSESKKATISQIDLSNFKEDSVSKSRYVGRSTQDTERPDLGSARVVITGGRALKSVENFKMIEKLAEKLGGAVGATRAAVDAGYVPNDLQVGQTGKIVAPELYMAFGVSGAIQHLAGIKDSKVIVAVNKDADAPIFQIADYGLVGDLFEVIPELLEKLPEKK